ncbi:hypothetical protein P3L10_026475 [Capsicum annuum]
MLILITADLLAVVVNYDKKPFLFTIWGDLADNEGAELLHHLHEYPVILARRIGVTEFRGALRLATRYQSIISTNPQYVQVTTLTNWVKHNERMLLSYTLRSSSLSSSSLNLAPIEDQVLAISTIPELLSTSYKVSPWKTLSLPDRPQPFYLLVCSNCSQFMRPKTKKMVRCFRMTIGSQWQQNSFQTQPVYVDKMKRCHFEVNIMDASDTIMVMISETLGERILSLTTEQISVQLLAHKLFKLQLQKPLFRFPDQKAGTLAITFFTEIPLSTEEPGKRQKIDPPTPVKKN